MASRLFSTSDHEFYLPPRRAQFLPDGGDRPWKRRINPVGVNISGTAAPSPGVHIL